MSGEAAGAVVGKTQSVISRWEKGEAAPTADQVDALTTAYGSPAAERRRVRQMANELAGSETQPARLVMRRAKSMQDSISALERAATTIRVFQPNVVCGVLQTEDYMRAMFSVGLPAGQVEKAVEARLARRPNLDDPARTFTLIHGEGALRWNLGGPQVMAEQCDRLAAEQRPHIRVGVVPWEHDAGVASLHGFDVYDQAKVVVGTLSSTLFIDATDERYRGDVAEHINTFERIQQAAVFGDEARERFTAMAQRYRSLL